MNKCIFVGRLSTELETKKLNGGSSLCKFSIAVNKKVKTENGSYENVATFIKIVTWNKTAEACAQYLKKGSRVLVEGELQNSSWENKEGKRQVSTEINALTVTFLDSKQEQDPFAL